MSIKRYEHKVVISGNVTEIYSYDDSLLKNLKDKNEIDIEKEKDDGEKETVVKDEELIPDDSSYHRRVSDIKAIRKKLDRLITSNVGQYKTTDKFVTLTFSEYKTRDEVVYCWKKFKMRLKYLYKDNFEYIAVIERGTQGTKRLHIHVIFFGLPYIDKKELAEIWKYGFITINKTYGVRGATNYLLKYLDKTLDDDYIAKGKRFYFPSRGLKKPIELYFDDDEFENYAMIHDLGRVDFQINFNSQYVGDCNYIKFIKDDGIDN